MNLGKSVLDFDWDVLVILDACRYDLFCEAVRKQVPYILSVGSSTEEWFEKTFTGAHYDFVYLSANPNISNYMIKKRYNCSNPFTALYSLWDWEWNDKLKTVPPEAATTAALFMKRRHPDMKTIIHYMQPHHPFIGKHKLQYDGWEATKNLVEGRSNGKTPYTVWDALKEGSISKLEFWKAYKSNLELALREITRLNVLKGKIMVTSDHGNCIGEDGLYSHFVGSRREELVKVPFVNLKEIS